MILKLTFLSHLCETDIFEINGVEADSLDFGNHYDHNSYGDEGGYGCGNMQFQAKGLSQKVRDKYDITLSEYQEIIKELKKGLSFGSCELCT